MLETINHFLRFHPCDETDFQSYAPTARLEIEPPTILQEIWKAQGLTTYGRGFIALTDPLEWAPLTKKLIPNSNSLVCFRTGMGGLIVYLDPSRKKPSVYNEDFLLMCPITRKFVELTSDCGAILNGWLTTSDILNNLFYWDLYQSLLDTSSHPDLNHAFGFRLFPTLGGDLSSSNFHQLNTKVYWDLLTQL